MTLFLTSSPSGCPFEPGPAIPVLDRRNHFLENLRAVWPDHPVRGLAIAADPHAYAQNDEMCRVFLQSFADAHLPLTELVPCDARNQEEIGTLLPRSGFVMLCGGHVPTQNHFFAQLGLPGLFHNYHGIVLGVSAGPASALLGFFMLDRIPEASRGSALGTQNSLLLAAAPVAVFATSVGVSALGTSVAAVVLVGCWMAITAFALVARGMRTLDDAAPDLKREEGALEEARLDS